MPPIDPTQYLMDALAVMTGGLVNDMKTLILGLVVCSFILMALDILKDLVLIPVATSLLNPAETYQAAKEMYHRHRLNRLPAGPTVYSSPNACSRREVEITPLRQYDLDLAYRGVDSLEPNSVSIYDQKQNNWDRDGVELSGDRYQELEDAMDEADRRQNRMSDEEAYEYLAQTFDDYRRRNR